MVVLWIISLLLSLVKMCGILKMMELVYRFVWMLKRHMRTTDHLTQRYGRGSWALITGGSDGIGLEMAKELARKQFNIVIIARNEEKLKKAENVLT